MPQAITHILIPILLVSIFRDFYLKTRDRSKFPLHYVLIAGLGGVLPDIDIAISIVLNFLGAEGWNIHKTFSHSLFFPLILLVIFFLLRPVNLKARICNISKHNLRLSTIFLMLSIGSLVHILLDAFFGGPAFLFYPLSLIDYGLNVVGKLSGELKEWAIPILDGVLFIIWLVYLEVKHEISNFI